MHQTSSDQVKSGRDIPPVSSISDLEPLDVDTPPQKYLPSGNSSSQSIPRDVVHARHSTTPIISSDRGRTSSAQSPSKQPSVTPHRQQQQSTSQKFTPKKLSQCLIDLFTGNTKPDSVEFEVKKQLQTQEDEIDHLQKLLDQKTDDLKSMSKNHAKHDEHQRHLLEVKWQQRENQHQQNIQQLESQHDVIIRNWQLQVQELVSHRDKIQKKHDALIRRQQEESFKHMETGRWLPKEESRVSADFERIKTQIRGWSKNAAVNNITTIQNVGEEPNLSLMAGLSRVAVLENNQLPHGLSTPKGLSILLSALLADDVFTSLFRSPFFFVNDDLENGPSRLESSLDKIYDLALASNEEDAHTWRSQTLRLLLPPQQADNTDGEKGLRHQTEEMIAMVAGLHASHFAAGSARHLIDTSKANIKKLNSIYREAALFSYMLWTRKTAMRLVTLGDMESPTFDVDDSNLKPHTMVHPDDHDDRLKGRRITLIVSPLLRVFGTDEGKDYDKSRVWVPAEVWFDTK